MIGHSLQKVIWVMFFVLMQRFPIYAMSGYLIPWYQVTAFNFVWYVLLLLHVHIYLDSEACHPGRRLIRKCVWDASWFPLPFSFKQRCAAMISEQTCSRKILSFQLEQKVFKVDDIMIEASIVLRSKIAPTDNCFQSHLLSCKSNSVQAKVFN